MAFAFDHQNGIFRAGNDEFVIRRFEFRKGWIDNDLTIYAGDANFGNGLFKWNIRDQKRQ